jgi:hypothetical protein
MSFLAPLTFYHWLVGTIIVSFCSIEIFHQRNGPVLPFQLFGTLLSVALFLFLQNNFVLRDEIYYCLGGAAVFYGIPIFTNFHLSLHS